MFQYLPRYFSTYTIILVSIVITLCSTIEIALITTVSYVFVPPISKGKDVIVEDDVDLLLFTFEIGSSSYPIISRS